MKLERVGDVSERFLIWSFEHNGWWKPNSLGYTSNRNSAGRYSLKEAIDICKGANYKDAVHEAMVPDVWNELDLS